MGAPRRVDGPQLAALIGAVAGLVFVLVNAGDLEPPWTGVARVVGVAAFLVVLGLLVTGGPAEGVEEHRPAPAAWRTYRISVVLEVVALLVGTRVLGATGHPELQLPWVVLVVGVHFVPFAWAFRARVFGHLGWTLIVLGVLAGVLGLLEAPLWAVTLAGGMAAGAALLVFAAAVLRATRQRSASPVG